MKISNWLHPKVPLTRGNYLLIGFVLLAVKYNLDRLISNVGFNKNWDLTDYYVYLDATENHIGRDPNLGLALALTSLPFIILGTILTLRRLTDAALPGWLVCLFFLPFVNFLMFAFLSIMPSAVSKSQASTSGKLDDSSERNTFTIPDIVDQINADTLSGESHRRGWLNKLIPVSHNGAAAMATVVTALFGSIAVWLSINFVGEYGWSLFLGIPFVQGLAATLIYGYRKQRKLGECAAVGFTSLMFLGLVIFAAAVEGLMCLAMALPIAIPLVLLGALIGYYIQKRTRDGVSSVLVMFCLIPFTGWIEKYGHRDLEATPITTSVVIKKSKQEVWNQLVTFNNINEPKQWLFKAGIAYPVRAMIEGHGVGSIRRCQFSTGDFVEPITTWNEPNLLQFSVEQMPPPLVEISIYDSLKLPHLENYFVSEKGQFKLTALASGETLLEGTTWYYHRIWPRTYWKLWSDYILHQIHYRVLNHIKDKAEARD